eukprot:TRINITY_DN8430_c0_g1_i1.p1 TRINITY_DN8430_c0_g1~~TRINITY_DN8430_c0_g1_i1.p1  ORF type:complete len:352 (-),score=38.39 TRINITY_DN8430_c0_g1_i1:17-1012(-)
MCIRDRCKATPSSKPPSTSSHAQPSQPSMRFPSRSPYPVSPYGYGAPTGGSYYPSENPYLSQRPMPGIGKSTSAPYPGDYGSDPYASFGSYYPPANPYSQYPQPSQMGYPPYSMDPPPYPKYQNEMPGYSGYYQPRGYSSMPKAYEQPQALPEYNYAPTMDQKPSYYSMTGMYPEASEAPKPALTKPTYEISYQPPGVYPTSDYESSSAFPSATDPIGTSLSVSAPAMPLPEAEKPEYEGSDFRGGAFNQALGLSVNYLPPKEGESDLFGMKGINGGPSYQQYQLKDRSRLAYDSSDRQIIQFNHCQSNNCLLYTSPSPRDATLSRMPSSA